MSKSKPIKKDGKQVEDSQPKEEFIPDGEFKLSSGIVYYGAYLQRGEVRVRHGKGKLLFLRKDDPTQVQESYEGDWVEDKMEGEGTFKYSNNDVYSGNFVNGKHEGYGTYHFTDGSYYSGYWKNHRMHGTGEFKDSSDTLWRGEFREGSFLSIIQPELKEEAIGRQREEEIKRNCLSFVSDWAETVQKVDKKNAKELLSVKFASEETVREYVEPPYVKFEDKNMEKWTAAFNFIFENEPQINVLKEKLEPWFLDATKIKAEQFTEDLESGQVVEISSKLNDKTANLGLCYLAIEKKWVVLAYEEVVEKKKK